MPKLDTEYIRTGKLRYVVMDFPLESIHPHAFKAAEATHCAGEQGKYWEMHERLFANQGAVAPNDLIGHARALNLDIEKFRECLDSSRQAVRVREGLAEGRRAGVKGTPTFVLGFAEPGAGSVRTVRIIRGALAFPALKSAIDRILSSRE